jgi:hypothetical protein
MPGPHQRSAFIFSPGSHRASGPVKPPVGPRRLAAIVRPEPGGQGVAKALIGAAADHAT